MRVWCLKALSGIGGRFNGSGRAWRRWISLQRLLEGVLVCQKR